MKNSKGTLRIILGLFIAQVSCFVVPQTIFCQTETLEGVQRQATATGIPAG